MLGDSWQLQALPVVLSAVRTEGSYSINIAGTCLRVCMLAFSLTILTVTRLDSFQTRKRFALPTSSPSLTIMAALNGTEGTTGLDTPNVEITCAVTTCIIFETFFWVTVSSLWEMLVLVDDALVFGVLLARDDCDRFVASGLVETSYCNLSLTDLPSLC